MPLSDQTQALESLAGVILLSLDAEGRIEQINSQGCSFLGFSREELVGRDWFACCSPESEDQRSEFKRLLTGAANFPEYLLSRVKTRSGELRSVFWHSLARTDAHGRALGVVRSGVDLSASGTALASLVGDLTAFQRAQKELARRQLEINRAGKKLAYASRMSTLGEIATGIAHEVNQPLAAIASYAKAGSRLLAGGQLSNQEMRELLDKINAQAQRAGRVLHKVRSQISPPDKKHRRIDMNTLLRDTLDLLDVARDAADVSIEFDLARNLPPVEMDINDLQQVTLSLMRNAIEAMQDNREVAKILRLCTRQLAPNSVLVSITDSGGGIRRELSSSIYEPFYTTRKGSMGMGLTISRSIINGYDGVLRHCPAKPRGSKFYFAVPAAGRGRAVSAVDNRETVAC